MDKFCYIEYEHLPKKLFARGSIRKEKIYIHELDLTVNKITVCSGRKLSRTFKDRLCEETSSFLNVLYTDSMFEAYGRKGQKSSLMTYLPVLSLKKCACINGVDIKNEPIAIIKTENTQTADDIIFNLCGHICFARVYAASQELTDRILENTGLCAPCCQGEPSENFRIFVGENLMFEYTPRSKIYKELVISHPDFLNKYSKIIPSYEIFDIHIRNNDAERYIKSKMVKIIGIK